MKITFKVKALSDLIFIASSNTEGNIKYLDYIPGSVFMGIVANKKFDIKLIDGTVRFSDADILIKDKPSIRIPLTFHYKKLGDKNIVYNSHRLEKKDYEQSQFKQIRSGYMFLSKDNQLFKYEAELNYSQKSARDKKTGRSAKSQMFGFKSIPEGSEFYFSVTGEDIEEIVEILEGIHYVGKSKRTEYGKIRIVKMDINDKIETKDFENTYIYFKSRVCLVDECGNPTYNVKNLHPKLKSENVVYEECKLRTYEYSPYNFKRRLWDSQRCVIDKGSVAVLRNVDKDILEDIKSGVGVFLNEGFGEVVINPWFLKEKSYKLENYTPVETKSDKKSKLAGILKKRKDDKNVEIQTISDVYTLVNNIEFVKWFGNITPSQWGNIRKLSEKDNFYYEIEKYITSGLKRWREDQANKFLNTIRGKSSEFVKFLAIQMAKKVKK